MNYVSYGVSPVDEQALGRAQAKVREAAERFGPLGRPAGSTCACPKWPCACSCHKERGKRDDQVR